MLVTDLNYCQRCRKPNMLNRKKTNYCGKCSGKLGKNSYNRYASSETFISTSFVDCIDGPVWFGFKNKKYSKTLIEQITNKFPNLKYIKSNTKTIEFKNLCNQPLIYLVSDNRKCLLKVGQTVNPVNRFSQYYNISEYKPIKFDLFIANNFIDQDLYESKVRNFLEFLGYSLPKDNTNARLKYIHKSN